MSISLKQKKIKRKWLEISKIANCTKRKAQNGEKAQSRKMDQFRLDITKTCKKIRKRKKK